ncbi:hypothetical protein EF918_33400 [Streptomyces sp. WAC06614]|nr:hypothetical protein EF918_33400 [Streptomyces sp. WAC06614]
MRGDALGGYSGAGALACEIAERIAAHGWHPPLVAVGGAADGGPAAVRALARILRTATAGATATAAAAAAAGGAATGPQRRA